MANANSEVSPSGKRPKTSEEVATRSEPAQANPLPSSEVTPKQRRRALFDAWWLLQSKKASLEAEIDRTDDAISKALAAIVADFGGPKAEGARGPFQFEHTGEAILTIRARRNAEDGEYLMSGLPGVGKGKAAPQSF